MRYMDSGSDKGKLVKMTIVGLKRTFLYICPSACPRVLTGILQKRTTDTKEMKIASDRANLITNPWVKVIEDLKMVSW